VDQEAVLPVRVEGVASQQEALRELIEAETAALLRLARRMLGDREDARDLVQDALLSAHLSLESFRGECSLRHWVYRILVHEGIKRLRRRRLRQRWFSWLEPTGSPRTSPYLCWGGKALPDPEQTASRKEQAQRINRVLDRLPPRQHAIFVLRFLEGFSVEEIAATTGIGTGTVKTHLVRALKQIRSQGGEEGGQP
jgi:RNA polymerase sigma-70 factor (ECF subfamily)